MNSTQLLSRLASRKYAGWTTIGSASSSRACATTRSSCSIPTATSRPGTPGAEAIKGYKADEIIGQHFSLFYPPERSTRRGRSASSMARPTTAASRTRAGACARTARASGPTSSSPRCATSDGELLGFAKVTRDLTERRRHEETLRQSEERFRLLVESVRDYAIFMLDPDGRVATWNAGAQRIKGYSAQRDHRPALLRSSIRRTAVERELARARAARSRRARAASRTKAGACARTARASGPTWSSPRCATSAASCSASPRSRAT